ncbi:carbohydrate-binding module family 1 protein [Gonapodya prolifera JEL478]|uniref:Carbohydrate-binding module family 1 protein n=1 Tax=Gonapodya prolifera (strain JEL478) TaxID=1344416 RepID=A0A139A0F1_GONPJ|nr:carbohydrate-binding module family 1 protein [Gonapodya prolifera JEL478]|eukprot:KXS10212.1 carbohydrate-binding module family 1 protein [Gonapodya prolifera JEL478]
MQFRSFLPVMWRQSPLLGIALSGLLSASLLSNAAPVAVAGGVTSTWCTTRGGNAVASANGADCVINLAKTGSSQIAIVPPGEVIDPAEAISNGWTIVNDRAVLVVKSDATLTWLEAIADASLKYKAELVQIQSTSDQNAIFQLVTDWSRNGLFYWVGADSVGTSGNAQFYSSASYATSNLVWDGSTQLVAFSSGEPNNANGIEQCLEMYPSGLLNDLPCTEPPEGGYIAERRLPPLAPETVADCAILEGWYVASGLTVPWPTSRCCGYDNNAITCDNGRITGINLNDRGLKAPMPVNIGSLTEVTYFSTTGNGITGTLPASFGELSKLQEVRLYLNNIGGPLPPLLGLKSIFQMIISGNQFTALSNMTTLTTLRAIFFDGDPLSGRVDDMLPTGLQNCIFAYVGSTLGDIWTCGGYVPPICVRDNLPGPREGTEADGCPPKPPPATTTATETTTITTSTATQTATTTSTLAAPQVVGGGVTAAWCTARAGVVVDGTCRLNLVETGYSQLEIVPPGEFITRSDALSTGWTILNDRAVRAIPNNGITWFGAVAEASRTYKGELVRVQSPADQEALFGIVTDWSAADLKYWIGADSVLNVGTVLSSASYAATEVVWDSTTKIITFRDGEPNNFFGLEQCIEMQNSGLLNDDKCSQTDVIAGYFVERRLAPETSTMTVAVQPTTSTSTETTATVTQTETTTLTTSYTPTTSAVVTPTTTVLEATTTLAQATTTLAKPTTTAARPSTTTTAKPTTATTKTMTRTTTATCSSVFERCGGIGWTGPTCCRPGSQCVVQNPYYSQCLQVPNNPSCAGTYAQCGGIGYTGPTCCQAGFACVVVNPYYSGCSPV